MKKYFYSVLVLALFAIGFVASDDSESSSFSSDDVPASMETISAETMLSDLDQNEIRAQKKYSGEWLEIVGKLGNMDSDGDYFSLEGKEWRLVNINCSLPNDKKEELTDKLINMEKGNRIAVKGKVTDVGEVIGYRVKIVDVYRK